MSYAGGFESSFSGVKKALIDCSIPIYILLNFVRFYVDDRAVFLSSTAFLVAYGVFLIFVVGVVRLIKTPLGPLVLILMLGWMAGVAFGLNETVLFFPLLISNVGFALALAFVSQSSRFYALIYYGFAAIFILYMLAGVDPANIFFVSRNYISVFAVLLIGVYYVVCALRGDRPSIMVPLTGMALFMYAIGRAGIASGAAFLLGTLMIYSRGRWYVSVGYGLIISVAVYWVMLGGSAYSDTLLVGIERFERLGGGGQRDFINEEYFQWMMMGIREIFFGPDMSKIPAIVEVDGNPHNSYLRLHYGFSLFGLISFFLFSLWAMVELIRGREYYIILVSLIVFFRIAFDSAAFYGPLDVLIFFFLFYPLRKKRFV